MKKAIVLLLALTLIGGAAFAQVTTKVAFDGKITLIDQDLDAKMVHGALGTTSVSLSGTSADGLKGFSYSLAGTYGAVATVPLYNSSWNGWYYAFDKMVKFKAGRFSFSDYRTLNVWNHESGYPGTADRLLVSVYPMAGLEFGVTMPFALVAGEDTADMLQKTDLGFKYVIEGIGTLKAYADLNLLTSTNVVGLGFAVSAIENANVIVTYKGTLATASSHAFGLGADYTMDALYVYGEFDGSYATAFGYDIFAGVAYDVSDAINVAFDASYSDGGAYDAGVTATYAIVSGLTIGVNAGYDGAVYYSVPLKYKISF